MSIIDHFLLLLLGSLTGLGMIWVCMRAGRGTAAAPGSRHWDLVYVDDNGELLFTLVRVLDIDADGKRLTAWCTRTGAQRVFKVSKILKATDMRSGRVVSLPVSTLLNPERERHQRGAHLSPA